MALFISGTKGISGWQEGVGERAPSLGKREGFPLLPPFGLRGKRGILEWVLLVSFLGTDNPMPPTVLRWKAEQMLWVKVSAPLPGCRITNEGLHSAQASTSRIIK